jgi:hypothetical protein
MHGTYNVKSLRSHLKGASLLLQVLDVMNLEGMLGMEQSYAGRITEKKV